jgi:hypothetical protein
VASPAAHDLREPVFGACRYVRNGWSSSHALERRHDRVAVEAEQPAGDCSRSDLDEQDVVEADAVERVIEREHALDLVRNHGGDEHLAHRHVVAAARAPVGDGEDRAEVVGRVRPLRGQPRIVVVEPANQRPDVERGLHRVELVRRSGHAGAVLDDRPVHDRPDQATALLVRGGERRAAERVGEHEPRRRQRLVPERVVVQCVPRQLDEQRVRLGPAQASPSASSARS